MISRLKLRCSLFGPTRFLEPSPDGPFLTLLGHNLLQLIITLAYNPLRTRRLILSFRGCWSSLNMYRTQCPFCLEPHNYRKSSVGDRTRCVTCGNYYRLPAVRSPTISGTYTCLGCIGLLTFGGCLLAVVGMGLHRETPKATQDGAPKEQEVRVREQGGQQARDTVPVASKDPELESPISERDSQRQREHEDLHTPLEKRRQPTEARQKAEEEAKEEAAREAIRRADLENKGLPYYPRPRTLKEGRNAEEWYQLLLNNQQSTRIYGQATAALSALKEEGLPFLLDNLGRQTTPKSRQEGLRLIRIEYVHRNDLHKLLSCLLQFKNYPNTRLLALELLEKRAKDLKKELVPEIERLVEDLLDNSRNSEETKEEIRNRIRTILREAK